MSNNTAEIPASSVQLGMQIDTETGWLEVTATLIEGEEIVFECGEDSVIVSLDSYVRVIDEYVEIEPDSVTTTTE